MALAPVALPHLPCTAQKKRTGKGVARSGHLSNRPCVLLQEESYEGRTTERIVMDSLQSVCYAQRRTRGQGHMHALINRTWVGQRNQENRSATRKEEAKLMMARMLELAGLCDHRETQEQATATSEPR